MDQEEGLPAAVQKSPYHPAVIPGTRRLNFAISQWAKPLLDAFEHEGLSSADVKPSPSQPNQNASAAAASLPVLPLTVQPAA
jgi:hypothetical protein